MQKRLLAVTDDLPLKTQIALVYEATENVS